MRAKLIYAGGAFIAASLSLSACESRRAEAGAKAALPAASAVTAPAMAPANSNAPDAQPASADDRIVWQRVGEWSGQGPLQTESFPGDTGGFRIRWKAANDRANGKGHFSLTIHSAISGRPLQVAVDDGGVGEGTAYVSEDPRIFFAVVDAANLDWSFTIEEALTR